MCCCLSFFSWNYFSSYAKSYNTIKPFKATLNIFKKEREEISTERRNLSKGYGLGFALSLFFIIYNYLQKTKKNILFRNDV